MIKKVTAFAILDAWNCIDSSAQEWGVVSKTDLPNITPIICPDDGNAFSLE